MAETNPKAENDEGARLDKIKVPGVEVEKDYKASKKYSVSSADQSSLGAEQAEAATAPQVDMSGSMATDFQAGADLSKGEKGDPEEFRSMAREVDPKSPKPAK